MIENKILKWALVLGIIVVLNLFFNYALKVAYKAPEWDAFCQKEQVIEKITTKEACLEKGGQWDENIVYEKYMNEQPMPAVQEVGGYCNLNFACQNDFDTARKDYEKKVFISLVALGVISIVIGFVIPSIEVVSISLSLGGVLSFVVASIRYWSYASEYLQVVILGIALAVLIYLGVRKFK